MIPPPRPFDESNRRDELLELNLLDTPAQESFDRITRLAVRLFQVPIVLVTLVDKDRVWFKSALGTDLLEVPREISFCGHAILNHEALILPDALEDERFRDNPLVTANPPIRFYAGHPLSGPKGRRVGALCLIDHQPREFGPENLSSLKDLAALVETQLGVSRVSQSQRRLLRERDQLFSMARMDSLTGLWNRGAVLEFFQQEWENAIEQTVPLSLILADMDHFKRINDTYGHLSGDQVLKESAARIQSCLRDTDLAGRYGGEEFMLILPGVGASKAWEIAERIRRRICEEPFELLSGSHTFTISLGCGTLTGGLSLDPFFNQVDQALYQAKNGGRNRTCRAPE